MSKKIVVSPSYEEVAHTEINLLKRIKRVEKAHPQYPICIDEKKVTVAEAIIAIETDTMVGQNITEHYVQKLSA